MARHRSLRVASTLTLLSLTAYGLLGAACSNVAHDEPGDQPEAIGTPSALGNGLRIAQLNDPSSIIHGTNNELNVSVTGATFLYKDEYSETGKASAVGAIFVQDFHSNAPDAGGTPPFSGIQLFEPTFEPASAVFALGDVLDFVGEYQQYDGPVPAPGAPDDTFMGMFQPEMKEPIVTFRFDYSPPTPTIIPVSDLATYATGYKWMSMLCTVENVVVGGTTGSSGRTAIYLTSDTSDDAPTMDNEFYPLPSGDPKYGTVGTKIKSVTGIVTYFYSFHISPRSNDDIVLE
jgi:hypothetical protein